MLYGAKPATSRIKFLTKGTPSLVFPLGSGGVEVTLSWLQCGLFSIPQKSYFVAALEPLSLYISGSLDFEEEATEHTSRVFQSLKIGVLSQTPHRYYFLLFIYFPIFSCLIGCICCFSCCSYFANV